MIRLSQPANQAPRSIMPRKTQKTNQINQTRHQGQSKNKCQSALEPIFFCKNCLQNTRKLCLVSEFFWVMETFLNFPYQCLRSLSMFSRNARHMIFIQ